MAHIQKLFICAMQSFSLWHEHGISHLNGGELSIMLDDGDDGTGDKVDNDVDSATGEDDNDDGNGATGYEQRRRQRTSTTTMTRGDHEGECTPTLAIWSLYHSQEQFQFLSFALLSF